MSGSGPLETMIVGAGVAAVNGCCDTAYATRFDAQRRYANFAIIFDLSALYGSKQMAFMLAI